MIEEINKHKSEIDFNPLIDSSLDNLHKQKKFSCKSIGNEYESFEIDDVESIKKQQQQVTGMGRENV